MPVRLRKFIGAVALIVLVIVWALVAMAVAQAPFIFDNMTASIAYYVIAGIGWEFLPKSFPGHKTVQRRLKGWLALDCFHTAWAQLAQRYARLHGINWDQVLLDGSKKPSKKGARTRGRLPSIAVSVARPST